jgi:hypothetical protein
MIINTKQSLLFIFCLPFIYSCTDSSRAKTEETYMMNKYAEKAERPSPPTETEGAFGQTSITLYYSQPSVKGREIWDGLVPYDKIWRTGANEATIIKTTNTIIIEGDTINTGKYSFFTIPSENTWTVMINKKSDLWGAYDYDEKYDVARFEVVPVLVPEIVEKMTFTIDSKGIVEFAWANLRFNFQISEIQ